MHGNEEHKNHQETDSACWYAGSRNLYCIDGPVARREVPDNPDHLCPGIAVLIPHVIGLWLALPEGLSFTLREVRTMGVASMGFCEIEGQPGRGAWILLRHLLRCDWHTGEARTHAPHRSF